MDQLVNELQKLMPFKDTIDIGDIVMIAGEKPQMLTYALVRSIEADVTRRDEWWHLGLTFLLVPPQEVTWTLRTEQMTGMEIFTMGGDKRFIKAVDFDRAALVPPTIPELKKDTQAKPARKKGFIKRIK
ncbi:MAG: hypothetical protein H8E79_08920 [Desulfobulbaceae bacterium]|uniref:Uncharacterized protein n=1 Tax=Candidatus Desulfatifera sulfidica TaxID=2841691 RepID=A0A8J6TA57_9BACT|nr:hypothetical protein [Candidatus Desulfatifera sulfidica]